MTKCSMRNFCDPASIKSVDPRLGRGCPGRTCEKLPPQLPLTRRWGLASSFVLHLCPGLGVLPPAMGTVPEP
ncbi:hypothetical protein VULLAG_LOCUS3807 [Vulpes lagopus]